ncbi:hypothetical protein Taro_018262 [Colocasia esculenta]|uniref:Phytocyanin domain-containing protein n=1 Tax=Colocasia esculenta TaxID=4460 RepID=A0A843UQY9_COLES|nr:hypothetical protein [Colocasia esculenta]
MAGTTTTLQGNLPMSGLLILLLVAPMAAATQFKVGDSLGWRVPSAGAESYNQWAEKNRFQKGDSLLFVYPAGQDSLLQVSKDDYGSCNTANPIKKFTDGSTTFTFSDTGAFYFISGVADNCNKGEKMVVVVLADRNAQSAASPSAPVKVAGAMGVLGSLAFFAL